MTHSQTVQVCFVLDLKILVNLGGLGRDSILRVDVGSFSGELEVLMRTQILVGISRVGSRLSTTVKK